MQRGLDSRGDDEEQNEEQNEEQEQGQEQCGWLKDRFGVCGGFSRRWSLVAEPPLWLARGACPTNGEGSDMYGVVRRYEGVTDSAEMGRRVQEGFVPLITKIPGFVAYYWLDAGNGVMTSMSVFEDRSGVDESVRLAADWIRDNAASLMPNPAQVTSGEVVASATG
jgi:hypothetical protein